MKCSFGSVFGIAKSTSKWVKAFLSFKNGVWQKLQKFFGLDPKALGVILEEALERCIFLQAL
ncbi:unnamed protein product [Prunus armeniaca]